MQIVTVALLNKGIFKDELTYFSTLDIAAGSIVSVPIKNKPTNALVLEVKDAKTQKSEIKSSDFALKKISKVKIEKLFLPEFLSACRITADRYCASFGQTVKSAIPQYILENISQSKTAGNIAPEPEELGDPTIKQIKFILQDEDEERLSYYKSWIRESFAKKQSVMICLPTVAEVTKYAEAFGKGIADYTILLHNDLPKKTLMQNWNKAVSHEHPLLLINTGNFLAIPRPDIKTIIVERESSSAYKNISRPHIDFRFLAEQLAEKLEAKLILGDLVLRAETVFLAESGKYHYLSSLKYRSVSKAKQYILNCKNKESGDKNAYAIGDDLKQMLTDAVNERSKTIIYAGRKGLFPNTVCNDCGLIVNCRNCQSPLVLHKNPQQKKYVYLCHKCGTEQEVNDKCPHCESWRLSLLGTGTEKIEEELFSSFAGVPIFRLDTESAKSLNRRKDIVRAFFAVKGPAFLVGTEALLPILEEKAGNVVATSIDGLFSLPDFRVSEKILNTLLRFRQYAEKRFIIQTRNPEEKVFRYVTEGNLIDFYREEIEERMKFGYAPFKVLIKISREGKEADVCADMEKLDHDLADFHPAIYPALSSQSEKRFKMHAVIKIPSNRWVDARLLAALKTLPPDFIVDIEPDSIL